jgi:hypothetical protein
MIDLPEDIIRHMIELSVKENHLVLLDFPKEMFDKGMYEKGEKEKLFMDLIIKNYNITKVPFFEIPKCKNIFDILENFDFLNEIKDHFLYSKKVFSLQNYKNLLDFKILKCILTLNRKYKWDDEYKKLYIIAIKYRNFKMISFLHSYDCSTPFIRSMIDDGISNDDLEMLEFLISEFPYLNIDDIGSNLAIFYNNIRSLKFIFEKYKYKRSKWQINSLMVPIKNNNVEILELLYDNNLHIFEDFDFISICSTLSMNSCKLHLKTVKWLDSKGLICNIQHTEEELEMIHSCLDSKVLDYILNIKKE